MRPLRAVALAVTTTVALLTATPARAEDIALEEILARVTRYRAHYVVVTGGEPMIAPEIVPLTGELPSAMTRR